MKILDAFTDRPGRGNPAGVVFLDHSLPSPVLQAIARQVGASETAFLQSLGAASYRTRFFTPLREVDICGHATIASFYELAMSTFANNCSSVRQLIQQSNAGELAVEIHRQPGGTSPIIWMELDRPQFRDCQRDITELLAPLGLCQDDVDPELPLQVAQNNRVFIPLRRLDRMLTLQPDFAELTRASEVWGIRGVTPYSLQTLDASSLTHLRHFAPVAGVNEDPVTGTSNGYLGYLLWQTGFIGNGQSIGYIGEQGQALGKDGKVQVRISTDGGLWIGGTAYRSAEIEISEEVLAVVTDN